MGKYLIILSIVFSGFNIYSQSSNGDYSSKGKPNLITNTALPNELLNSKIKILDTYKDVEGSPFIENYTGERTNIPLGKIYDANREVLGAAFIMYNAYTDQMEISAIEDAINFYILKKESNSFYIKLQDKFYRAYVFDYKLGYFLILSENDDQACTLLKKEKVVFIKGSKEGVSLVKGEPSSFKRIKDSYLRENE